LAPLVERYPELKAELQNRYRNMMDGAGRALIEHLFGAIGDGDDVIEMVKKYLATRRGYDGQLARALRDATVWHEPVPGVETSYYIRPASVAKLRKLLFEMTAGTPHEAALAASCLVDVDQLRDEYGIAAGDPRHPDIRSGRPWPIEAGRACGQK
jgi:hypothetical protein